MRHWLCALAAVLSPFVPQWAAAQPLPSWRDGDLVFQQSRSAQSEAIRIASGSVYTHMGIVRLTAEGPVVIEASRVVTETPLQTFLARGAGGHFAVYRVPSLSKEKQSQVIASARTYLGRPYDIYFRLGRETIYCSELPFYAFQSAGISLGHIDRFGDLSNRNAKVKALFLSRWLSHPDCKGVARDAASCWKLIQGQGIVTPISIAEDRQVERIYSNF